MDRRALLVLVAFLSLAWLATGACDGDSDADGDADSDSASDGGDGDADSAGDADESTDGDAPEDSDGVEGPDGDVDGDGHVDGDVDADSDADADGACLEECAACDVSSDRCCPGQLCQTGLTSSETFCMREVPIADPRLCPPTPPAVGSECDPVGLSCTYPPGRPCRCCCGGWECAS